MRKNVIYGLASTAEPDRGVRYVGLTSQGAAARLAEHLRASVTGTSAVYKWIRRVGADTITTTVLEELGDDADLLDLLEAEARWIKKLRWETLCLLNHQSHPLGRRRPDKVH